MLSEESFGLFHLDADISTTYNRLIKAVHKKAVYKLGSAKKAEFLKQEFRTPRSKAAFISEIKQDTCRKEQLRKELQQSEKNNIHLERFG